MMGVGVEILGVVAVGIGTAAAIYAALHALRKAGVALPRWLLPAGIGLAMIAYSVWNDYAWFDRARDRLPAGAQVLLVGADRRPWAPWTYLAPVTVRFAALDAASVRGTGDGLRQARILLVDRRGQTVVVPQEFDCAGGRIRPARGDWSLAAPDDPAFAAVCEKGESDGRDPGDRG